MLIDESRGGGDGVPRFLRRTASTTTQQAGVGVRGHHRRTCGGQQSYSQKFHGFLDGLEFEKTADSGRIEVNRSRLERRLLDDGHGHVSPMPLALLAIRIGALGVGVIVFEAVILLPRLLTRGARGATISRDPR